MRYDGNSKGITRSDYEQFSKFLGITSQRQPRECRNAREEGCEESNANCARPIAMVYGVNQSFVSIYDPELALETGTIFEELNKPFYYTGCRSKSGEGCR